jgi:anaerobic selenocysteine-containing dehydrogenase
VPWLRQLAPEPEVELNAQTARELGIEAGAWVWIETPTGKIRMKSKLTNGLHPRVVSTTHGWWQGCAELGLPDYPNDSSNANILVDNKNCDPVTGGPGARSQLCKIYKVGARHD